MGVCPTRLRTAVLDSRYQLPVVEFLDQISKDGREVDVVIVAIAGKEGVGGVNAIG